VANAKLRVQVLLAEGKTIAEIARATGLAANTVRYHRDRLRTGPRAVDAPTEQASTAASEEAIQGARRQIDTRQRVAKLLELGLSRIEVARRLGLSKATVSYHARRLGHDIDRVVPRPTSIPIAELCVAGIARSRGNLKRRLVREGLKEERCEGCGLDRWQNRPLPLALHHLNGDRDDNRLENLQILCPNCHALTENFSGRNRRAREAAELVSTGGDDDALEAA
jgi:DNA-binding CsgD family transcriptional regulator